jgi:uncharacterized YceG family protein
MTPRDDRERTADERERARLEREARRAARRGEPPPPVPEPPRAEPPPVEPPPPVEQPPPVEPLSAEPPLPLTDDTRHVDPPETRPLQPAGPRRSPRDRAADRAAAARVALRARRKRQQAAGARRQPREPRPPRERGSRSNLFRAALVAGAVLALVAAWFLLSLFQPFKGDGDGIVRLQIPTGASVTQIGDILEDNGVVSSAFFFRARVTLGGSRGDLKPGSYKLARDMSYGAAIDELSEGPPRDIVTVTIPEGRSRGEIGPIVEGAGLAGSYSRASVRSPGLALRRYGAGSAKSLEGFLFPATYELKRGASAEDLVAKQVEAFKQQFAKVDLSAARRKNLTAYDILIIASMVEREAGVARDRPLIASVIYNRLKAGIPLGIDATIRYALGNWTEPLKVSELASPTPYNTRTNAGLPPGPIGNPGLESIQAAADPASTDYIFFVVKPCGDGEHAFAETDAEFQRDVARYEAERERQGGRSPTDC